MTPLEIIGVVSGVIGLGTLLIRAERRWRALMYKTFGDGSKSHGVFGRLDTVEERIAAGEKVLQEIRQELSPNHGSSLHDMVVRIDERTRDTREVLARHLASPHPKR